MESIQGRALVASPYLSDVNFLRSVVYILQHDEQGALGLILNRPTEMKLAQWLSRFLADLGQAADVQTNLAMDIHKPSDLALPVDGIGSPHDWSEPDALVYCGGPVEGPLMLLQEFVSGEADEQRTVFLASDEQRVLELLRQRRDDGQHSLGRFRIFEDYAGWGAGQLDEELRYGGWLVWDIQPEHIFGPPDELWQLAVKQIGREILAGGIAPDKIPHDPAFN